MRDIEALRKFVRMAHINQKRKYTGEPYFNHLENVCDLVSDLGLIYVEVALCHDLLEDTECTPKVLFESLLSFGYSYQESLLIVDCVKDLTDKFTADNYPWHNRRVRKRLEATRMEGIHHISQTVKYADMIDNTGSIVEHDKSFAKVYLKEKETLINYMTEGAEDLRDKAKKVLSDSLLLIE